MALKILPQQSSRSGLVESMGTGLGQGLQFLLQDKMNRMMQAKQMERTQSSLEKILPKDISSAIAGAPQELQGVLLKNYLENAGGGAVDEQLANIFGGGQGAALQGGQASPGGTALPTQPAVDEKIDLEKALASIGTVGDKPTTDADILRNALAAAAVPTKKPIEPSAPVVEAPTQVKPAESDQVRKLKAALRVRGLKPAQRAKFQDQLQKQYESEKREVARKEKAVALEKRAKKKEQLDIDRSNAETVKEINEASAESYAQDRRIRQFKRLIKKRDLSRPAFHNLLKTVSKGVLGTGIDLHYMESADSQEFVKLSTEFLKGAKRIFGARVTNFEAETFLKMIPTLSQTRAGKKQVMRNMELANNGARIKKMIMDQLVEENGGRTPLYLESKIQKKAKPFLDALEEEFEKNLKKRTAKKEKKEKEKGLLDENPITTALDALFGQS